MNRSTFTCVAAGAALLLTAARGASAQPALPDSLRIGINRVFATWTDADGPGCALGVSRDGRVVFQNGYGMANLETGAPITPGTIFHVASISKQFTAAAIVLLEKDGKLSLDDDVRKYLPELPDYGHRITIRHLLNHTSGLRDQWDLLAMARGRFEENRITEGDVLEIVPRQKALNFVPGTEYLYSNTGYTLAGTIVRRVSGKSLRAFAQERIFAPLGMTQTHFHDDYTMLVKGRAAAYVRRADGWHVSIPNFDTYGATSLYTTAGDLLKWAANATKPVVGDSDMMRRMWTSATLTNGDTSGYGLGITSEVYRGTSLIGHGGADAGYRAHIGTFPEHGLSVAVLCNAASAVPAGLVRGVADVMLRDKLAPVPAAAPVRALVKPSAETLARMAAVWVDSVSGAPMFITRRGDSLVVGRVNGPALLALSDTRFQVAGQTVEFSLTPSGLLRRTLTWPTRTPVLLTRRDVARPTRSALEGLAGTYYSEELGATYVVVAKDSTIVLKTRWATDVELLPAYGDTFVGQFQVAFTRGRNSAVDGMLMSSGRVRNVRFVRAAR